MKKQQSSTIKQLQDIKGRVDEARTEQLQWYVGKTKNSEKRGFSDATNVFLTAATVSSPINLHKNRHNFMSKEHLLNGNVQQMQAPRVVYP